MMRHLAAVFGLLVVTVPAVAQRDPGTYSQPVIPATRDLDRLNLEITWKNYIPLENRSDGIATVQMIDDKIFVQTRSNLLVVLSEATGSEIWRMAMPKRYTPVFPLAANRNLVLVVNGPRLYLLDRLDGKIKYHVDLPSTVAAGLAADIHQCFVVLSNNRIVSVGLLSEDVQPGLRVRPIIDQPETPNSIQLAPESTGDSSTTRNIAPSLTLLRSLRPPYKYHSKDITPSLSLSPTLRNPFRIETGNRAPSIQMMSNLNNLAQSSEINSDDKPRIMWELQANRRMDEAPLMFGEFLIVAGADRSVFVCNKHAEHQNSIRHEYLADHVLSAPVTQYGPDLYFCVGDGNVYWVNVEMFRNSDTPVKHIKRYLTGSPIDRKPVVTDDSIFFSGTQAGMTRLDRKTFSKVWTNLEVDRLYAANPNVLYAGDRRGNLVVLDRARGLKLATLDIKDFSFPIVNDRDDRLFLAAHNGLLLCLNDRTYRRPELLRKNEPAPPADPHDVPARKQFDVKDVPEAKKAPEPKVEPEMKKAPEPKNDP